MNEHELRRETRGGPAEAPRARPGAAAPEHVSPEGSGHPVVRAGQEASR